MYIYETSLKKINNFLFYKNKKSVCGQHTDLGLDKRAIYLIESNHKTENIRAEKTDLYKLKLTYLVKIDYSLVQKFTKLLHLK